MFDLKNLFGKKKSEGGYEVQAPPGEAKGGVVGAVSKLFDKNEKEVARLRPVVDKIAALAPELKELSDDELKARSTALRQKFQDEVTARLGKLRDPASGESYGWQELDTQLAWSDDYNRTRRQTEKEVLDELLVEAFALVREAGDRTIGLRHFDVQMIGGAVLHSGRISEMRTGEGKTLVATLPVYLNALTGRGVHVITVNDYLAERDANWMRPIYEFLGLSVAFLTNDMDTEQRQAVYGSDVVYATNSEVGFDYLRDNMAHRPEDMVQRPPNFAIVDEVDNILIDEARTPLIISAQVAKTERALRRQQMAQTCDGVARKLMPGVTDREVELLLDSLTVKGGIQIGALMQEVLKRGAFSAATEYLVEAYLRAEKSARVDNAAHLLDLSDEFFEGGLISAAGKARLEAVAMNAVQPAGLRATWRKEVEHLIGPFAHAYANTLAAEFGLSSSSDALAGLLAYELGLAEEGAAELAATLENSEDKPQAVALLVAEEMARRGLVEDSAIEAIAAELLAVPAPENAAPAASEAPRQGEASEAARRRQAEKAAGVIFADVQPALLSAALAAPGNLQEADTLLGASLPESDGPLTPAQARALISALEEISLRALLPFETSEKLWETVRLAQGRTALRREVAGAIGQQPGDAARKISALVEAYGDERAAFLKRGADTLRTQLAGRENIAQRAQSGENVDGLRRLLLGELTKTGPFAEAMKAARAFTNDQNAAHLQLAEHLVEEMAQWVEVPRDARRALANLMSEGGPSDQVRERILLAVRDLPGENTELPALVGEAARQLQTWRSEGADALLEKLRAQVSLPASAEAAIRDAILDGEYSTGFDNFIGEQLLTAPDAAPLSEAIETFGASWDEFKAGQTERLVGAINETLNLSQDAYESLLELLGKPINGPLDAAIFAELATDAVSRHLEPLLNEENATAFADEVKRRIPLAKDVQNKLKPADFAGRSGEQLQRVLVRLLERSFEVMPFEDYKRVVRNLGWFTEKDEKRRTGALTDMGTLIAEREAGTTAFTDPENFLDTLVATEILTDEEAVIVRGAQAENPQATLSALIDRTLRLPAERRRRLAETKLQEVQPVLDQSIKAHALFQREVNYVIDQGREIVIVDEFTGRKMPGRRYSEGLHEALEAKHGLEVQLESQTVATITIQNYFRLYNKLAGMTGTAKTEEAEFAKTYGMEVVSIPTNRNIQRKDYPDVVYKTAEAKFRAVTFEILEHHCAGQPVLVGTRSVEMSERLSERLKGPALQTLVLSHLVKTRLWDDKNFPDAQRQEIFHTLHIPIGQITQEQAKELRDQGIRPEPLSLLQVKNIAKAVGLPPDALHQENLNKLLGLFTQPNVERHRLETALRVGLPHNVLNAKNHRNEARIIAEAARPAAVTIATNMAGRGVDIVLGGTLDVESRWRVMTVQTLARHLEGKSLHVRSRNQETTSKFEERLSPARLQDLAWASAVLHRAEDLERAGQLEGQGVKEIKDTLGQELTTPDLKNKVRSRARRLGLLDSLPLDTDPLQDDAPLEALNADLQRLMGRGASLSQLRDVLQSGIAVQSTGRDFGESLLLHALSTPLRLAQDGTGMLLQVLTTAPDLDHVLLEGAAASGAGRMADFDATALAERVGDVTEEWVQDRLHTLHIHDATAARHKLEALPAGEVELNEAQLAHLLGEASMGTQWIRERLRGWKLIKGQSRAYQATPEMQQVLGDSAVVHYRLDRQLAGRVLEEWNENAAHRRALVLVEIPNLILLSEMAGMIGGQAPFLQPEWLHQQLVTMGVVTPEDVFQAQMMGQAEDEQGNVQEMPIDVLVYQIQLNRLLPALDPTLREAVAKHGRDAGAVLEYLGRHAAWATPFIDREWVSERLGEVTQSSVLSPQSSTVTVFIETGVAGQSADIVLESEARPEDIAHTSEQEIVKKLGGLHILGTERHESRRIDNQLRGRAGRQGDPGSSRFYVSLEDELWRLFGVRGQWMLNKWDEDEAVEAKIISKSIERAQKKVELNHFESRKHVLQYDDVMNVQREMIYRERRRALMGGDLRETALDWAQQAAVAEAEKHCPREVRSDEWDTHKFYAGLCRLFGATLLAHHLKAEALEDIHWVALPTDGLMVQEMFDVSLADGRTLYGVVEELYTEREAQISAERMRHIERWQVTRSIDEYWMEHLAEMDYLRDAIWQEGYAQKEPIGVYRQEGYALFKKMMGEIRREVTESLFSIQVEQRPAQPIYGGPQMLGMQEARLAQTLPMDNLTDDGVQLDKDADGDWEEEPALVSPSAPIAVAPRPAPVAAPPRAAAPAAPAAPMRVASTHGSAKVGRNDPCPCGSGKKYKKCCLPKEQGLTV